MHDAEARSQRRRQQPGPRGGPDQRELLEPHLHRPRARSLSDDDVDFVILERRIQDFLDDRRHPVNFVDEQHFPRGKVRDDADQIARLLDGGPRRGTHRHAQLVRDHVRERRLAKARRAVQQHVIERLLPLPRGGNRHLQVLAHAILADVLVEHTRAQPRFVLRVLGGASWRDEAIVAHWSNSEFGIWNSECVFGIANEFRIQNSKFRIISPSPSTPA